MIAGFYTTRSFSVLNASLLFFLCSSVILPWDRVIAAAFFVGVIPSLLVLLVKYRAYEVIKISAYIGVLALIGALVLPASFVSDTAFSKSSEYLRYGLELVCLIFAIALCAPVWRENSAVYAALFFAACVVACFVVMGDYWSNDRFPGRMVFNGISYLKNPVHGSGCLLGLWFAGFLLAAFEKDKALWLKCLEVMSVLVLLTYMVLSQSRGPLASLLAFLFMALVFYRPFRPQVAVVILVISVFVFVGWFVFGWEVAWVALNNLGDRGLSYRLGIWRMVIENLPNSLFFGQGIASPFIHSTAAVEWSKQHGWVMGHTHSLALGIFYSGGLVGLCAFIGMVVKLAHDILHSRWSFSLKAALAIVLIGTLLITASNSYHPIDKPRPIWLMFWLPLLMVVALTIPGQRRGSEVSVDQAGEAA